MMQAAKPERGGRGERGVRSASGRNTEVREETEDNASDTAELQTAEDDVEE